MNQNDFDKLIKVLIRCKGAELFKFFFKIQNIDFIEYCLLLLINTIAFIF